MTVEGPYGRLFPADAPRRQLWIAGGIGITPFLGRAPHLDRLCDPVDIRLVYCVQDEARARFLDELEDIAGRLTGFSVTAHLFYRQGPLDDGFLQQHCPDRGQRAWFTRSLHKFPAPKRYAARYSSVSEARARFFNPHIV